MSRIVASMALLGVLGVVMVSGAASAEPVEGPTGRVCVGVQGDVDCPVVAVTVTGDADPTCRSFRGCVAASATGNATPDCPEISACLAASGTSEATPACAEGTVCLAASGTGDATPDCPSLGACGAASGTGEADPVCTTPWCATVSGAGNSTGCTSASGTGASDGGCYQWDDGTIYVNSHSASLTDEARADAVAASGTGPAEADWVAVSGTEDARCHSGAYPPSHVACVAVSGTGEAHGNEAEFSGCQTGRERGTPALCYDPGIDDDLDHAARHVDRVAEDAVEDLEPLP